MNKTRYAKLSIIAINVFTEMYKDIANASGMPPEIAYNMINNTKTPLTQPEKENIKTLLTKDGYGKCEQGLLYKILRKILNPAKQGWGRHPSEHDISTSDDVERIRITRNKIFHRVKAEITEDEKIEISDEIFSFAKRLDNSYNQTQKNSYESKIKEILYENIDNDLADKYVALGLKMDELELKLESLKRGQLPIRLYSGKKMNIYLADSIPKEQDSPNYLQQMLHYPKKIWEAWKGTSKEPRKITVVAKIVTVGFELSLAEEIVEYLHDHCSEINDGSDIVFLKRAEIGSINLFIDIVSVQEEDYVFSAIMTFIERLIKNIKLNIQSSLDTVESIDVLLFPAVDEGFDCSVEEYEDSIYSDGHDINLELTVFALSNENVYESTLNFIDGLVDKTNHIHNLLTVDNDSERKYCIDVILEIPMTTRENEILKKQREIEEILRRKQKDSELNDDVNVWRNIRNNTLSRLLVLRNELIKANEKIKTTRKFRNITVGASGLHLASFTSGILFWPAAAIISGTAGIPFLIETYIEKSVLATTQEEIYKDKQVTLQLLQRATAYRITETTPFAEEVFTISLNTISDLGEHPFMSFIKSFAGTESAQLLNAINEVEKYTENLKKELEQVQKIQRKHSMY